MLLGEESQVCWLGTQLATAQGQRVTMRMPFRPAWYETHHGQLHKQLTVWIKEIQTFFSLHHCCSSRSTNDL
ncbi:hypothetical protein M747DRAFT_300130 [Aspergillus niger ATCC 13496]|uniref:Uncharacterized protein n=1 Tax=Aspergillus niger ATCC 13496 TaxID=1353008 RepID=A0A370BG85_ASPNG|nr:hypothetical protein M747DRAFT_300130 [Aspergillus niger ATCC 13496]